MSISKGTERIAEQKQNKNYMGIAISKILAINPTKQELEVIYGTPQEKEPEYVIKKDDGSIQVRIDFVLQIDENLHKDSEGNPINKIYRKSIFLNNTPRKNSEGTKVQVIDKYGRTAWVTSDEYKAKAIPTYANGPANLDSDYRACRAGEELLTANLVTYLGIPSPMKFDKNQNKWYLKSEEELVNCEARLDRIDDYFKGDFTELKQILSYQPKNRVKILVGRRATSDGAIYPEIFDSFLSIYATNDSYNKMWGQEISRRKAAGGLQSSEFSLCPFKEIVVTPTNFIEDNEANVQDSSEEDLPF